MYQPDKIFPLPESLPAETVRGFSADLTGLIAWLETQNPTTEYNWSSVCDCLGARFLRVVHNNDGQFRNPSRAFGPLSHYGDPHPNYYTVALTTPHTYGAALERARSALREGG